MANNMALDMLNLVAILIVIGILFYFYLLYNDLKSSVTKVKKDYDARFLPAPATAASPAPASS